VVEKMTR